MRENLIELNEVYLSGYLPITNMKYEYKINNAKNFLQKRKNIFYTIQLALSPSSTILFFSKIHKSKIEIELLAIKMDNDFCYDLT